MSQDQKLLAATSTKSKSNHFWVTGFFSPFKLFVVTNLILYYQASEAFGHKILAQNDNNDSVVDSLNSTVAVNLEAYSNQLIDTVMSDSIGRYSFFHTEKAIDQSQKIEPDKLQLSLSKQNQDSEFIKDKIHFSSSLSQFTDKKKDKLVNKVVKRIQEAKSRSIEDQTNIEFVLSSKNFRIELTQSVGAKDSNNAGAYGYESHTMYLRAIDFQMVQKNGQINKFKHKRSIEKLIHEFGHASDTLQNLNGSVTEETIKYHQKISNLVPFFPFKSKLEHKLLKAALDSGEKYIISEFLMLLLKARDRTLTEKEKSTYNYYNKLAREFYQPRPIKYFMENPQGKEYVNRFESGNTAPIILGQNINGVLHQTRIYIRFVEKNIFKNKNDQLVEGVFFSGYSVPDPKLKDSFIQAIYNDYVFELAIKETNFPIYSEQIKRKNSPKVFAECYLTAERYTILREFHPEIVKAFFPKVIEYRRKREAEFLQKNSKNEEGLDSPSYKHN